MKISNILKKYDTDKVTGHSYGPAYNEVFSWFDRKAPLDILEIGIQRGGSLCAWQDYFPKAKITGIDIGDVVKPEYRRDNITYIFQDVKNTNLEGEFDIIIDDGSHLLEDIIYSIKTYSPKLKKGGVMIVEDVQDAVAWTYNAKRLAPHCEVTTRDYQEPGRYDNFLIIIRNA